MVDYILIHRDSLALLHGQKVQEQIYPNFILLIVMV